MTVPTYGQSTHTAIPQVRSWVEQSERILVLTGAGISTDSGIRDYRGPDGVWTTNPGASEKATIGTWRDDREFRINTWRDRLHKNRETAPNRGHYALVDLEYSGRLHMLVTQNIDGLHLKAGSDPTKLIELHGHDRDVMCLGCDFREPIGIVLTWVSYGIADPHCPRCGGILKPAVVSFDQDLFPGDWERAKTAAGECDLLLAIGSTLTVPPAFGLVPWAKDIAGAKIVIINNDNTLLDSLADVLLRGSISDILPELVPA